MEAIIQQEMLRPHRCMQFMRAGRLVRIRDGKTDWGWGVYVNHRRTICGSATGAPKGRGALDAKDDASERYQLDCLLACGPSSGTSEHPDLADGRARLLYRLQHSLGRVAGNTEGLQSERSWRGERYMGFCVCLTNSGQVACGALWGCERRGARPVC